MECVEKDEENAHASLRERLHRQRQDTQDRIERSTKRIKVIDEVLARLAKDPTLEEFATLLEESIY